MKRRRLARESARAHKAVAVSHPRMAGCTENVVALTSALQNLFGHRKRHRFAGIVPDLASIKISVLVQLSTSHRALDRRTSRPLVGVEIAARQRILPRLHMHVDAAGGAHRDRNDQGHDRNEAAPSFRVLCERVGIDAPNAVHSEFTEVRHLSWAPPKLCAGPALPETDACPPDRTFCRMRTRLKRSDPSKRKKSAAR